MAFFFVHKVLPLVVVQVESVYPLPASITSAACSLSPLQGPFLVNLCLIWLCEFVFRIFPGTKLKCA